MVVNPKKLNPNLGFFRFRNLGEQVLITNDIGRFLLLTHDEFDQMLSGTSESGSALYQRLLRQDFMRHRDMVNRMSEIYRYRYDYLDAGPTLHIMIITLRCNYTCQYCHASREPMGKHEFDMSIETARKVVDLIFETTNEAINIEFQGGEPLANWDVLKFVVEYATEKNKQANKDLAFTLVSNLSLMDEEKMAYLIEHEVYMCTSLDGPRDLHEHNRICTADSSYDQTVNWIRKFQVEYLKRGFNPDTFHVDALMTTTRQSLPLWKEIIDEYVDLGLKSIHFRSLNPFGFVKKTWNKIGYSADEFIDFYKKAFDYIIELNLNGVEMIERAASIHLTKILTDRDPNYMEQRSPCGAGIGQVAYNYNGQVFTCDEGRMMAHMGDDLFLMGDVQTDSYQQLMESEPVRSLVMASIQDGLPLCSECAYMPYCGVCPIYNYSTQGDIFGQMPNNDRCKVAMAMFDHLFEYIAKNDPKINEIFGRWITLKIRQVDACDPY